MTPFAQLDATARGEDFSGVVRIERAGEVAFSQAYGLANRALAVPNSDDTVFALASGTKAFTALAVLCLVHDGVLSLQTRARELLGSDLPLINDAVTVEMLLAHRSGIGDYLDEAADWDVNDHVLSVPVHTLADTQSFLAIVGGYPQVFAPGERLACWTDSRLSWLRVKHPITFWPRAESSSFPCVGLQGQPST